MTRGGAWGCNVCEGPVSWVKPGARKPIDIGGPVRHGNGSGGCDCCASAAAMSTTDAVAGAEGNDDESYVATGCCCECKKGWSVVVGVA